MPRVPTYSAPQVQQAALPNARQTSNASGELLGVAASQDIQSGRALTGAASVGLQIQQQENMRANQLRVDDALNQAREAVLQSTFDPQTGYLTQKGRAALDRPSGKPLSMEYTESLQTRISDLSAGLGNDEQRRQFHLHANDLTTSFRGQLMKYETEQQDAYETSVYTGTITNRADEASKFWNDPLRVEDSLKSIDASGYALAKKNGLSGEAATAFMRKQTSNALVGVISSALQNDDINMANGYLQKYSKQMDADDILKVNGVLTKEADAKVGTAIAVNVMGHNAARINPTDTDRLVNLVTGTGAAPAELIGVVAQRESGNRDTDAAGNVVTSPKGAKGRMQVMDGTNKDPGYGVPPAKDDSLDERARVGRDYLGAMLREYKGNLPQALAAYNAGPGNVDKALAAASAKGDSNWMNYLPKPGETIPYVRDIMAKYGAGAGAPQRATLQEVHDDIRSRVGDNNPRVLKIALDSATQQFETQNKAIKQHEDEAVKNAMQELITNGGRFSDLPLSVRANIPVEKVDTVMNFGARVAKGDDTTNNAVYQKLSGDPAYLTKLSDNEFFALRSELSESDWQTFARPRGAASGQGFDKVEELNTPTINSVLNNRLQTLRIDPTPKDGEKDAARVGAIRKFVNDRVLQQQKANGKQMTDAETGQFIDRLFATSVEFQKSLFGFNAGQARERMLTMKAADIPSATKKALLSDFERNGISEPTDGDLLGAYWNLEAATSARKQITPLAGEQK